MGEHKTASNHKMLHQTLKCFDKNKISAKWLTGMKPVYTNQCTKLLGVTGMGKQVVEIKLKYNLLEVLTNKWNVKKKKRSNCTQ